MVSHRGRQESVVNPEREKEREGEAEEGEENRERRGLNRNKPHHTVACHAAVL